MSVLTQPETRRRPPGPPRSWLFGNLKEFGRDPLGTMTRWAREYGDVVSARLGPHHVVFLNHPDLVEEVLVNQNRKFIKRYGRETRRTLGAGLLTSEGDFWRGQRKLAQPAFHRERIANYARLMVDYTERILGTWENGQVRDVQTDMMRLTLEIVAKTLFGAEIGGESVDVSAALETLMLASVARSGNLMTPPHWVPTPLNLRIEHAIRRLEKILKDIILRRARKRRGSRRLAVDAGPCPR